MLVDWTSWLFLGFNQQLLSDLIVHMWLDIVLWIVGMMEVLDILIIWKGKIRKVVN